MNTVKRVWESDVEIAKGHDNKIRLLVKAEDSLDGYEFFADNSAKITFLNIVDNSKVFEKDVDIDRDNSEIVISLSKDDTSSFPVRKGELEDSSPFLSSMKAFVDVSGTNPFRIVIDRVVVNGF